MSPTSPALTPSLLELMTLLAAGVVVPPLFRRLRLSPVVGFLVVGLAVGPAGLQVFTDPERVAPIAELGVVFLLFAIGLELSFERLRALRGLILGLGGAQMIATLVVVAFIALAWGLSGVSAVVLAACVAFSSTAVAMQILSERQETASAHGRAAFAVLLLQDLAVAPALILVEVLAAGPAAPGALAGAAAGAVARAGLAIVLIVVVGRFLLRRVCHLIISERSPELRVGAAALMIAATAGATHFAGLSAPLGAFLAGLLIAETPLRAQVEADLEPFRGLLLGVFFIGVGLSLSPSVFMTSPGFVIAAVVGLAMLKAAIVFGAARALGRRASESARVAGLLAQCGEFGFVVVGAAAVTGALPAGAAQFMALVIALSMLASPLFDLAGRRLADQLARETGEDDAQAAPLSGAGESGGVLIVGFGRVGKIVARVLDAHGAPWVALDERVRPSDAADARALRGRVMVGNARRADVLVRAGLARASALVITLEDPQAACAVARAAGRRAPDVGVIARARDEEAAEALRALGAAPVCAERFAPGPQLASEALVSLGAPAQTVRSLIEEAGLQSLAPEATNHASGHDSPPDSGS